MARLTKAPCPRLACCCGVHAALNPDAGGVVWPGVAGVFQVSFILASGLLFFLSRTPAEGDMGYSGF